MAYKDDEFINGPGYTTTRYLSIITLKFRFVVLGLSSEIFLSPDLTVQVRIVYERLAFLSSLLYFARSEFFFSHTKKGMVFRVIPEDADRWHRLVEGTHIIHLCLMAYIIKVCHNLL